MCCLCGCPLRGGCRVFGWCRAVSVASTCSDHLQPGGLHLQQPTHDVEANVGRLKRRRLPSTRRKPACHRQFLTWRHITEIVLADRNVADSTVPAAAPEQRPVPSNNPPDAQQNAGPCNPVGQSPMTEPPPAYTSNSVAKSAAIYNSKQLLIWRTNSRVDRNVAAKAVSHATAVQPSVPTPTVTSTEFVASQPKLRRPDEDQRRPRPTGPGGRPGRPQMGPGRRGRTIRSRKSRREGRRAW